MSVFVDTSAFLAFISADDPNNSNAVKAWHKLLEDDVALYTSNYVVVETVSLIHSRFGIGVVRRFIESLLPVLSIVWVDDEIHSHGLEAVLAGGRRGPSLVDSTSFAIMSAHRIDRALAYDRHFEEQGFTLGDAG